MNAEEIREDLEKTENVEPIHYSLQGSDYEFEIEVKIENPKWGLPSDLHDYMTAVQATIADFSHVSKDSITLYLRIPRK